MAAQLTPSTRTAAQHRDSDDDKRSKRRLHRHGWDPDAVASCLAVSSMTWQVYVETDGYDGTLFALACLTPVASLPLIRRNRPVAAVAVNMAGLACLARPIQSTQWGLVATAALSLATVKSIDQAWHFANAPSGRHYAALMMVQDCNAFVQCETLAELWPTQDFVHMAVSAVLIAAYVWLFTQVSSSSWLASVSGGASWLTLLFIWVRCFLVGLIFERGMSLLTYQYRIFYSPFKTKHANCMNGAWRSASLAEFWSKRWNTAFQGFLKRCVYIPLLPYTGRHGAVWATFGASGLFHAVVLYMDGVLSTSVLDILPCMLFFLAQPLLIYLERKLFSHSSQGSIANRLFVYAALFATCPLAVEPILRACNL